MRALPTVAVAALLILAAAACATDRAAEVDAEAEAEEIRATWENVSAAFLAGEWEEYQKYFIDAPRFRMIHPGQREWLQGRDEFASVYQDRIRNAGGWEVSTNRFDVSVGPAGNVAWTAAEVVIGQGDQMQTSWQLAVWEKIDGKWRVSSALAAAVSPDQT